MVVDFSCKQMRYVFLYYNFEANHDANAQAYDYKRDRLWVRLPLEEM